MLPPFLFAEMTNIHCIPDHRFSQQSGKLKFREPLNYSARADGCLDMGRRGHRYVRRLSSACVSAAMATAPASRICSTEP